MDKEKLRKHADEFFDIEAIEESLRKTKDHEQSELNESIFLNNHLIQKGTPFEVYKI